MIYRAGKEISHLGLTRNTGLCTLSFLSGDISLQLRLAIFETNLTLKEWTGFGGDEPAVMYNVENPYWRLNP